MLAELQEIFWWEAAIAAQTSHGLGDPRRPGSLGGVPGIPVRRHCAAGEQRQRTRDEALSVEPQQQSLRGNTRGRTAAILASFTSTCSRHEVDPQPYLTQLLVSLPTLCIDDLATDRWKAAQGTRPPPQQANIRNLDPACGSRSGHGSPLAWPRVAASLYAIESCRRLNIRVRDYLTRFLAGLDGTRLQRVPISRQWPKHGSENLSPPPAHRQPSNWLGAYIQMVLWARVRSGKGHMIAKQRVCFFGNFRMTT